MAEGRVRVAQGNDGDVDVGGLGHRLVVGAGVGHDQDAGLAEGGLDLVGEGTGGVAPGDGGGAGVAGELQDGTLQIQSIDKHVLFNSCQWH